MLTRLFCGIFIGLTLYLLESKSFSFFLLLLTIEKIIEKFCLGMEVESSSFEVTIANTCVWGRHLTCSAGVSELYRQDKL